MMHDAVCHKVTELTDISSTEKITSPFLYNIGQDGLKLTLSGVPSSVYYTTPNI